MFGTMSDQTVYIASSLADPSDKFTVQAESYVLAQVELLDKLGYGVTTESDGAFVLVDIDSNDVVEALNTPNVGVALTRALALAKWTIQDPMQLIGGHVGGGFHLAVEPE